jgi:hypothetical protein
MARAEATMIYRMCRDLGEMLTARQFPLAVEYGPERVTRAFPQSVIVIDRDRDASEEIGPAHGTQRNAKKVLARYLPCRALVWAASTEDGARANEHEHECDRYVDGLLSALDDWATEAKAEIKYGAARFAKPSDGIAEGEYEAWPGVVYLLQFSGGRGVYAFESTGAGQPEGTVAGAGVHGTVRVQRQGSSGDPEVITIGE